jgi:hypothetical protein
LQRQTLEKTDETFRAGTRGFVISYELAVTPVFVNNDIPYWKVAPIIKNLVTVQPLMGDIIWGF